MDNKRNYYRLMYVQMDAPSDVINASYKTIMQKLRLHPDLGGEEWNAQLLNEARTVLLDPERRAQYDRQLIAAGYKLQHNRSVQTQELVPGGIPKPGSDEPHSKRPTQKKNPRTSDDPQKFLQIEDSGEKCPFCLNTIVWAVQNASGYPGTCRCNRCDSPLQRVQSESDVLGDELRKVNRSYFEMCARLWVSWPLDNGVNVTVCDWSIHGCAVDVTTRLSLNQTVLIKSPGFDAIAVVRHETAIQADKYLYGLEYLTLDIRMEPGSVFSSAA